MQALVIHESMYGNTHAVADAIAIGLGPDVSVRVVPVDQADASALEAVFTRGFDAEPAAEPGWAHCRIGDAMAQGPVIQAFRTDRIGGDPGRALVGVLVFEEDGLSHSAVLETLRAAGIAGGNAQSMERPERM